jgi:Putative peptidoglycan binding domain
MKTIVILFAGLGLGTSALAQTGLPVPVPAPMVPAPAPAITAPVQTATVQPKPPRRIQRDELRPARKPAVENNTPAPHQNNTPVSRQNRRNSQAQSKPRPAPVNTVSYADALKRQHHDRHDHVWWTSHYRVIVLVNNIGFYYLDSGYWYPAYGYDPEYENYDYTGPIYTYGNLLPDQVIYNVQRALKDLGYYEGPLTGSFSAATRSAITAFQADNGLEATGAIDEPTVEALGLY